MPQEICSSLPSPPPHIPLPCQKNSRAWTFFVPYHFREPRDSWLLLSFLPSSTTCRRPGHISRAAFICTERPRERVSEQQWLSGPGRGGGAGLPEGLAVALMSEQGCSWEALAWPEECSFTSSQASAFSTEHAMLAKTMRIDSIASSTLLSHNWKTPGLWGETWCGGVAHRATGSLTLTIWLRKTELFYSPVGSELLFYSDLYCLVLVTLISNLYL